MGPLGIPSVEQRTDKALPKGIPGALALTACVLIHRDLGEYFATVGKAFAGVALLLVAMFIGQLGDGDSGSAMPVMLCLYVGAYVYHRAQIWKRGPGSRVYSTSPGESYLDPYFTALRLAWKNPPTVLRRLLIDNVLLYVVIEPALLLLFAYLLHLGRDVDGSRFVFAAGCALFWQALSIRIAYRRTLAAIGDAPLQQHAIAAATRQDFGLRPIGGTPHVARGPALQAADPPAVPAGVVDLTPYQQLGRFASTVASSMTPTVQPGSNAGSQTPQDAESAQAS